MSIITNGLGSNATNYMLGQFTLGYASVEIIVTPVEQPLGGLIPRGRRLQNVKIIVRYQGKQWFKDFLITEDTTDIVIKVSKIITKIINTINISVLNVKQTIRNFGKIIVRIKKG